MRLLLSSGAGHSHIAPMLPLGTAARDAGHDVVFVTGPDAVHHAESAGLPTIAVGAPMTAPGRWQPPPEFASMSSDEKLSHLFAEYMVKKGAAARLDDMLGAVRSWKPDLVVTSIAERAAMMAAVLAGVPYVMHAIGTPKTAAVMAAGWRAAEQIVRRYGLERLPARDDVPYLDIWPARLHPDGVAWEYPTLWPVRPEGALPVDSERPDILDGLPYERTVYLTLGTTHNNRPGVLETMVDAMREEDVNVVVTIGRDGDPGRFGEVPEHIRIAEYVPQEQLLPHVEAVVCHAGAGTVLGALAHGVPLVVSPLATDQFDMAAQVADAHAGVVASKPEDVRDAYRTVRDDPAYRTSAATVAAEIAAMPPPHELLDALRGYASRG